MARLAVTNPSLAGSAYDLGETWATLGRALGNDSAVVAAYDGEKK
ncbi:MAG TPA: hypothetical protein VGI63_05790 [Verrucomicrobiae bacterium]|jgi:hypothetical protein